MKKLILALFMAIALVPFFSMVNAETVTYDLTFYENYTYNLDTGVFGALNGWSATSRLTVNSAEATINSSTIVHHVLFWDKNNTYMGYGNIASGYEGSLYLGDYGTTITFPTGVARFAFTTNNLAINTPSGLGAYTYADIFDNPSYTAYDDSTLLYSLGTIFTNPSYNTYVYDVIGASLGSVEPYLMLWTDYAINLGVTILEVKNLIQNGQFNGNLNNWAVNAQVTYDAVNDRAVVDTTNAIDFRSIEITNQSSGLNVYLSIDGYGSNATPLLLRYILDGSINAQTLTFNLPLSRSISSNIFTFTGGYDRIVFGRNSTNQFAYLYSVIFLNSSTYTKSQLDNAIGYYGYPTYNVDLDLPDVTDTDFTDNDLDYILENASDYTGNIDDLDIAQTLDFDGIDTDFSVTLTNGQKAYLYGLVIDELNEVQRWEFYSQYFTGGLPMPTGINVSNYAYYDDLYDDAVAQTERYEWYIQYGVTSGNYAGLRAYYDTYYPDPIAFTSFDNLVVTYDRTAPVPPEDETFLESIESYFDDLNIPVWGTTLIALGIMILFGVIMGLLHAPMVVMLIIEMVLFLMFTIFAWFPAWIPILVVVVLAFLLYTYLKGRGNDA